LDGLEKVVDNKVEAEVEGDDDDTAKGGNDALKETRRRNPFPGPNSISNSLRAELKLYFQGYV
jgi:hypothetical protein